MKNLTDKRAFTSKENGTKGGRPAQMDFSSVARILLKGLTRMAELDDLNFESTASLADRRLINRARSLCATFDEVISQSRLAYLTKLEKLGAPNPLEVRDRLRSDLNAIAREVRSVLRVISVKAEGILQDSDELNVKLDADIEAQLQSLSKLEVRSLDKIVEMIVGIVEETLNRFGIPIYS